MSRSCPVCQGRDIPPDGPTPCRVMLMGECPAREETKQHRNFSGQAGREFDFHYLPLAGLLRGEVYTTNACRSARPNFDNPTNREARQCSEFHLPQELRHCQPEVIVLMGGVACSLADTHIDLDTDHGLPQRNSLLGGLWEGTVFPTFHPAAGLHEGQMILQLRQDFASLGAHLKGGLVLPHDNHQNPECRLLRGHHEVAEALARYNQPRDTGWLLGEPWCLEVAIDTESVSLKGAPWCLSFALDPDHGYVVLADDQEGVAGFARWVKTARPIVLLHHSLHDIPVLGDMGVEVARWRDTMVDAYHLADIPQGLKALGWRLLGVRMKSFEDTCLPHSLPVAMEYLATANEILRSSLTFQHQLKSGPRKGQQEERVLPGADKLAVGTWRKVQKALREDGADLWQRWKGWHDHDRQLLVSLMGKELPFPSIVHVPLAEAVGYAALDAIVTLRVHHVLRRRRIVL